MGSRHLAALLVVGGLLFSACSTSPFANGAPTGTYGTQACRDVHDAPWCELIFDAVATSPELKVDHEGIADVRIIPNPPGAIYGGGAPLFVRVTFTDGTKQDNLSRLRRHRHEPGLHRCAGDPDAALWRHRYRVAVPRSPVPE